MLKSIRRYTPITALRATSLLLSLTLIGCDTFTDCLDNDGPELSPSTLPNPILNQEYNQLVHVGIRNEPNDDRFDFDFTVSGRIPDGLETTFAGRDLNIFGTPIELGDFDFSVTVEVVEPSTTSTQTSGLCSITDRINYQWTVQTM